MPAWRNGAFRRHKNDPTAEFKDPVSLEILQAMEDGSDLRFFYTKERQDLQWRTVSPLELTHLYGGSHASRCVLAYRHLRQAMRHFVLSRIEQITRVAVPAAVI